MESGSAAGGVADGEVFLLLEEYCSKRSKRSRRRSRCGIQLMSGGVQRRTEGTAPSISSTCVNTQTERRWHTSLRCLDADGAEEDRDASPARSWRTAADRLVRITESALVPEVHVENQDDVIQKLVDLMIRLGDDIHEKIKENTVLQQQLSNLNYNMFEKLTSGVQNLVGQRGQATASEERIQRQKIAWAFEVTSRLSATGVVQRRRVLSFGELYIQQHHSAWVQQHGGWEEVFAVD